MTEQRNSVSPESESREAAASTAATSLSQRLATTKGRTPSISAIALTGDGKLVEDFLTETVGLEGDISSENADSTQLYIASFWGYPDIVESLLDGGADVNHANEGTLWTPLHAATFQEHGKVVMLLLERGANPDQKDSEGRMPRDFASASSKIWPHFAALGYLRSPKDDLIAKGIIKKVEAVTKHTRTEARVTRVSAYTRPGSAYVIQKPAQGKKLHMNSAAMAACLSGDVLGSENMTNNKL